MKHKVLCDKPYPIPMVERKNIDYAYILLQDYAGKVSEDTAVHTYTYQTFLDIKNFKEETEIISMIARVEMNHLSLLGKTISLLGVDPIFASINCENYEQIYWNSSNVNYTTNIKDLLLNNIQTEEIAIINYTNQIKIIDDKYIKILLRRIIEDEEIHLKIFKNMLTKFIN